MRSSSSRRRTPHSTPHSTYRRTAAVALAGVTALIAAAVQSGAASAAPPAPRAGRINPAHAAVSLSPSQRAELLRDASGERAATAKAIGLGAKEKLVVKDVVKDADGTLHTRYERTYAGLPVLGGDLIVDTAKSGATERIIRANNATLKVADLTPAKSASSAEKTALAAARTLGSTKSAAVGARLVMWAGHGTPVLADERIVRGV
ncbi:peptidase M4, partial [Streptomyces sp. NPDC059627]